MHSEINSILVILLIIALVGLVVQTIRLQYFKDDNNIDKEINQINKDQINSLKIQRDAYKDLADNKQIVINTFKEELVKLRSKYKKLLKEISDEPVIVGDLVEEEEPYNTIHEEAMQDEDIKIPSIHSVLDTIDPVKDKKDLSSLSNEELKRLDIEWNDPNSPNFKEWFGECNCIHCNKRRGNRTHEEYYNWKGSNLIAKDRDYYPTTQHLIHKNR